MSNQPTLLQRLDRTGIPLLLARLGLGAMFIYTGVGKVLAPTDFISMVRQYHMVPDQPPILLNLIGAALPWLEIVCGLLLIVGLALRGTALLLLVMLLGFTGAVALRALNIYHAQHLPFCAIRFNCGCGTGEEWICAKIPKNLGLCLLSVIIMVSASRRFCLRGDLFRPAPAVE